MQKTQDNRWHLSEYPDNLLKAGYVEWKYFNFVTPDYSGVFIYAVVDHLNILGIGGGRVLARVFATNDAVAGGVQKFSMSDTKSSPQDADMEMGRNILSVKGEIYNIRGGVEGLEWNLEYSPLSPPISGFNDLGLDPLDILKASWFIQMPKAKVKGKLVLNGKELSIDAVGYTDANWGMLTPLTTHFNWAQYNDDKISFVMGEIQNFQLGKKKFGRWGAIHLLYNNERISFTSQEFSVEHLKWTTLNDNKTKVPLLTILQGENRDYKLSIIMQTQISDPLYINMPFSLPVKPVIIEQKALFRGDIFRRKGRKNIHLHFANGVGFKEYTLRTASIRNNGNVII